MAAVTVTQKRINVKGSYREFFFKVNIATSGDTLATGLKQINDVSVNDGAITKAAASGGTVTFTTTGAVTGALVGVSGI
jgi:hypothetical protein